MDTISGSSAGGGRWEAELGSKGGRARSGRRPKREKYLDSQRNWRKEGHGKGRELRVKEP